MTAGKVLNQISHEFKILRRIDYGKFKSKNPSSKLNTSQEQFYLHSVKTTQSEIEPVYSSLMTKDIESYIVHDNYFKSTFCLILLTYVLLIPLFLIMKRRGPTSTEIDRHLTKPYIYETHDMTHGYAIFPPKSIL